MSVLSSTEKKGDDCVASFFPDEDVLKKANPTRNIKGLNIKERYGTGVVSISSSAPHLTSTSCIRYERNSNLAKYALRTGQTEIPVHTDIIELKPNTISVYLNGINLLKGEQYKMDYPRNKIILRNAISPSDDDLEIRSQKHYGFTVENVLILPIGNFTKEQIKDFAPEPQDVFHINRLIKNNPSLAPYAEGVAYVTSYQITEYGIIGTLRIYEETKL